MDRAFLTYYEEELTHIRGLAAEFAALHPTVARNLALDSVPCPDPYVERLLEGVAFLAARTRLKVDAEASRHVRNLLDALYPDLAAPAPAMGMAVLRPGPQVDGMAGGHVVRRGTRLVAGLREGLSTRATYATAQDVTLWPVRIAAAGYLQDVGALRAAGLSGALAAGAEAGLRLVLEPSGPTPLARLTLDRLDLFLGGRGNGGALFDAIFGWGHRVLARPMGGSFRRAAPPDLVGIPDAEALLPRVRPAFEGYRLVREYFLLPERFHYARLDGLNPVLRDSSAGVEIVILLDRPRPELAPVTAEDFRLFATPLVNLFEKECNIVEIDPRRADHVVHADRTRPRDFEIYRILRVEDADREGQSARIMPLYAVEQNRGATGQVYAVERRRRRPGEDELRRGQTRTSYPGDDLFLALSHPPGADPATLARRLDIRALVTNRDLPILDDSPTLTLETGDPVAGVTLIGAIRRPRPSLAASLPQGTGGTADLDALTWRWIAQLSLDHLSLAGEGSDAEPLRAMLDLYADRGDPALARHARAIQRVCSAPVMARLALPGPTCFGHGTEIVLDTDETILSGASTLLLGALLNRLFGRYAAINSFVRTRTRLMQRQEEVTWPMTPGHRAPI
ncbi:type VI secretion system baseplate subunit TssF [Rhodovulum tesquicola]|uniref:type VI secretion system baseplate subunit TssF n=1 Tax=Rhodovulum tesquicola TaxID=540254 RepID=UPI002096CC41|nr:type VI secretion system baseplate subunit TssF [Rhodovulum tesquicola]MCO8144960.1 type VI secretion system baseplate subunit TssF [Rhodovulum tesquicola]